MPPKKIRLAEGQTRMSSFFRTSSIESECTTSSSSETGETTRSSSTTMSLTASSSDAIESGPSDRERSTSTARRGVTASWKLFAESKWRTLYPWLVLRENGVFCQYCSYTRREVKSRAGVFATKAYTGNRPDKLGRHEASKAHCENQMAYQEQQTRVATHSTVLDLIHDSSILTVDENAFCDALRCMYFLCKNAFKEIWQH